MFDHNFGKINKLTDKTKEGRKKKQKMREVNSKSLHMNSSG